jgi:hypothetical protein
MPWSRSEPDPLKARRRQLAEQERLLAERMSQLSQELQGDWAKTAGKKGGLEPPVWRMEDEATRYTSPETPALRGRALARQRQRDMMIFFLCTALLLAIMGLVFWLWKTHAHSPD